jgi:hypothetical protein
MDGGHSSSRRHLARSRSVSVPSSMAYTPREARQI